MSFGAVIPFGGVAGWAFLQRTEARQKAVLTAQPAQKREAEYFRQTIGKITSADALVSDRRLLSVALGAFGLQDDLPNRAFIRKVLSEGTLDPKSLANKLSDKRYARLSAAFGFDLSPPRTRLSSFPDEILSAWQAQSFERAVGAQDDALRLALNARRELAAVARSTMSEGAKWFTILGQPPLRQVFETAFGLPKSFGALPIDRQRQILEDKSAQVFGSPRVSQFMESGQAEQLIRRFLVRSDAGSASVTSRPGSIALQLLQSTSIR